jgi:hypothetical protein
LLWREIRRDAASAGRLLLCLPLPFLTLAATLKAVGFPFPAPVIHELADLGLLHAPEAPGGIRSGDRQVQLARPPDVRAYFGTGVPRRRGLLLLMAVQCMVCGISGEPGEEVDDELMHVTSGNALEQLVRPRVRDLILPGATALSRFTRRRVAVVGDQLLLSAVGGGAMQRLTPEMLADLDGTLPLGNREGGLDGLVLQRVRVDAWQLDGWQSKGGHRDLAIEGGDLRTSVDRYVEDEAVSKLKNANIHGILVKAQVAMCQLLAAWHATLPGISLLPAGLTLKTTKNAGLARAALGKMRDRMSIGADVARVAGLPAGAAWRANVLAARIELEVHDGLHWLHRCLPDDLGAETSGWIDLYSS